MTLNKYFYSEKTCKSNISLRKTGKTSNSILKNVFFALKKQYKIKKYNSLISFVKH